MALPALLVAGLVLAGAPAAHAVTVTFASSGMAVPVNLVAGGAPVGFDIVFPTPNVYQDPPATGPGNVPPPGTPQSGVESRTYAYELTAVTFADLGNVGSGTPSLPGITFTPGDSGSGVLNESSTIPSITVRVTYDPAVRPCAPGTTPCFYINVFSYRSDLTWDWLQIDVDETLLTYNSNDGYGDYVIPVTVSNVPLPAAVWPFALVLAGLAGRAVRASGRNRA
jgi:hypothetical protein